MKKWYSINGIPYENAIKLIYDGEMNPHNISRNTTDGMWYMLLNVNSFMAFRIRCFLWYMNHKKNKNLKLVRIKAC